MKISLKETSLSIGFIFLLTVLSGIASAETLVFGDNFDSYGSDTFPSSGGWNLKYNGYGVPYQIVDNSQSLSSPNSLKLEAQYNWASAADHLLSEKPVKITYEVDVKIGVPDSITDSGRANARVSFVDPDVSWGKDYGVIVFGVNGLVGSTPYNYNQWYHAKIKLDMVNRKYDAWIDDTQIATGLPVSTEGYYKGIRLCSENAGHTRVWFDNVKVIQENSPSDQEEFSRGYKDGCDKGYKEGFKLGKEDGKKTTSYGVAKKDLASPYDKGFAEGYDTCFQKGYEDGQKESQNENKEEFSRGYKDGCDKGYKEGFKLGKEGGKKTTSYGVAKKDLASPYDKGFAEGYDTCFQKGYNAGKKVAAN